MSTFEIEPTSVRVHPMPVGGDFGGKGSPMDVPVAYLLSKHAGKPVKIVMTYQEELLAANSRHPSKITVSTGVTSQGNLTSLQVDAVFDGGASHALHCFTTCPSGSNTAALPSMTKRGSRR